MDPYSLKKLNAERRAGRGVALVTDLGDGRDRVVRVDDSVAGELGAAIALAFATGAPRIVDISARSFFIDVHLPHPGEEPGGHLRAGKA